MADIHIEDFYKDAARILVQLFNAFPRKTSVYVEDISGPDMPDEYGVHSARHQSCFACMLWLADEGYLRFVDTIRQEAIDQAVLTHRGFMRLSSIAPGQLLTQQSTSEDLNLPPALLEEKQTFVHLLRQLLNEGSSTTTSRVVHALLTTP